ncbi:type IV pilus twitching motility protein PilT [Ectothiorhodospira lacustris]|uniref:type IV pilus twitching motility protein PilT n=1 Tax=Ectothiorhodospira lacustris TaxID=2899127 RepID=UPI001EE7F3AA|nr:PilT/PilU family type 4a pilus ATPase [Ectothiorhodospira lacustris]MCG5509900.1 PilT/PilU family type 4a pilus ATPase [Ectothiorhodospira lacustris]
MPRIDAFLKLAREQGCSDLHLAVGLPPLLRMNGDIMPIRFRDLAARELEAYVMEILTPAQKQRFGEGDDLDFSYVTDEVGRFRANLYRKATGIGATFRHIPAQAPNLDSLGLPPVVKTLIEHHQGMVLVTGSTGTGKSTTLAAIIDYINTHRAVNIISLEDPVEFVHQSKRAQVIQREVGNHVPSYAHGLRNALREDPDVILVGELRDVDSMIMAMIAAETGILVLGTLHTNGAAATVDRIINAFPAMKQAQIRAMLSTSLRGVISQQLVRRQDGQGRMAAVEILVNTPAVANLLREGKTEQLVGTMQSGALVGMQTLDSALRRLLDAGRITGREAYRQAISKAEFETVREQG